MSININRYVDITSGVGAAANVPTRDLIGRLFTGNPLLPPDTFVQFTTAAAVASYFGASSEEATRATFYFSWTSKNITQPAAIQFARWVNGNTSVQSGTIVSTMDTITGLTSTAGLAVGSSISGTGIPANTVIASITSATALVMSAAATASVTETITFTSTGVAPAIFSISGNNSILSAWTSINNGSFGLTIGATTYTFSALDFTGAGSLAAVATIIQSAIQAESGAMWTDATVIYSNGAFTFTGGSEIVATIQVLPGATGTDITNLGLLGWLPAATFVNGVYTPGSIQTPGQLVETITNTLNASVTDSNNFGSFLFLNNLNLNVAQVTEAATWNFLQNNMYFYTVPVTSSNYASYVSALATIGGVGLTLAPPFSSIISGTVASASNTITAVSNVLNLQIGMLVSDGGVNIQAASYIVSINSTNNSIVISKPAIGSATEALTFTPAQYPEQIPMMVEAATNYQAPNSVQNYMFQGNFLGITPSVNNDTDANTYDAVSVNYYGQTQTAGTIFNFYQRGVLLGPVTSPLDMNTYINEIWLKDAAAAAILNLLIALTQLPANDQGRAQILTTLQTVINQALNNGTISVNKTLTTAQQMFITSVTNDPDAWYQVQTIGYWVDVQILPSNTNPVVYTANYTLVYSKDDIIRLVTGTDILI